MLDELDDRLCIQETEGAGRGVFATASIPSNSVILQASPYCQVILYEFRKEVCAYCFAYNGRNFKVKIEGSGLWFCSETCLGRWNEMDNNGTIFKVLKAVEVYRVSTKRKHRRANPDPIEEGQINIPSDDERSDQELIDHLWTFIPTTHEFKDENIDSYDIDQIKFIVMACARRDEEGWTDLMKLQSSEVSFFKQSQEKENKPTKISQALLHHIHLFTIFHKITTLDSDLFRAVLYRDIGNSFGIHEVPLHPDSEFLGWALYPSASFFNHACWPIANVNKTRRGRVMEFQVGSESLQPSQQVTISYGGDEGAQRHDGEDGNARRARIKEGWMFDCRCEKCTSEMI